MKIKKIKLCLLAMALTFTLYIGQVSASVYKNYFGIEITNQEYNNLLNLGFSEDEIYYMSEETFESNKDLSATKVAENQKYYKTIYTGLDGQSYSVEITKGEYDNQSLMDTRGTVTTEYKNMVTVISKQTSTFRYKVTVGWNRMPSTKSYDIIGIGFSDDVYISSPVYFNYHYCDSDENCTTSTIYYDRQKTATGGAAVYKIPTGIVSLTAVLYYDVAKDTTDTITRLDMYGDYSHATTNVGYDEYTDYSINRYGINLSVDNASYYDAIPCAQSTWHGTW